VEIDDARGRVFATALALAADAGWAHGGFDAPPLDEGLYWLVTSGDPRGAETLEGATIARPFSVTTASADPCEIGPRLAVLQARPHPRWVALDGFVNRRGRAHQRRMLGFSIAFSSLGIAAILELLLVIGGAEKAREDIARALTGLGEVDAIPRVTRRTTAGGLLVGILVALLGFALLAALLLWRAA
jgi:hypothetical protein